MSTYAPSEIIALEIEVEHLRAVRARALAHAKEINSDYAWEQVADADRLWKNAKADLAAARYAA